MNSRKRKAHFGCFLRVHFTVVYHLHFSCCGEIVPQTIHPLQLCYLLLFGNASQIFLISTTLFFRALNMRSRNINRCKYWNQILHTYAPSHCLVALCLLLALRRNCQTTQVYYRLAGIHKARQRNQNRYTADPLVM